MSKRQIDVLTRIPTSLERSEDIQYTTPRVHDVRFEVNLKGADTEKSRIEEVEVPVHFQPRNHLFLGHDGVHPNSVEEWEKRQKLKRENAATTNAPFKSIMLICTLVLIFLWVN